MSEFENNDIEPLGKLEDLKEFLKEYSPKVYTHNDEGYDYLDDKEYCITLTNQNNNELNIYLNYEFTISYDAWHCHFDPDEYDWLKMRLQEILNDELYICSIFIDERWVGSSTMDTNINTEKEAKEFVKQFLKYDKSRIKEAKEKGMEVRVASWNKREIFKILPK